MTKALYSNDVPSEIWETIFKNLPISTQNECQRVCRQWYLPAQRALLEHVVLPSCYDVEKFVEFFTTYGTPSLFSSVRSFRIGSTYTPPDRARHLLETNAIEMLICRFPNVLEFIISGNCINLTYFRTQGMMEKMVCYWPNIQVFRVDSGWLHPDERKTYLEANYRLRNSIQQLVHYEHSFVAEELGLKQYLSSFPRLTQIKVVSRQVCNLKSALPIIEFSERLKALDLYVTREDTGCVIDNYDGDNIVMLEKAQLLQSLKISMASLYTYTIDFIVHHFLALRQAHISVSQINIKEWTSEQRDLFQNGLLEFLCHREIFTFRTLQINYNEENNLVHHVLQELYHNIPLSFKGVVERHVHLGLHNNIPDHTTDYNNMYGNVRNFALEIKSKLKGSNTLLRSAYFNHYILLEGGLRKKSLKYLRHMDGILKDITSLTFDAYGMRALINIIPNIFEDTMQQFVNLDKISVHLSQHYPEESSFLSKEISTIHPKLTHLEITAGNSQDMLPLASHCFPSLTHVSLWFHCGWYHQNTYLVDMENTNLERFDLDVTPIRVEHNPLFFILKVTTYDCRLTTPIYYRVSMDYLSIELLDEIPFNNQEYITMSLVFNSIKLINLYLYRKYSDRLRPVLKMDPKDLIQTTLTFSQ